MNFSEPVTLPTNKADAFLLTRTFPSSDTVTVSVDETIFTSSGGTQAVLTFTGPIGLVESQSLADGNYTLTVLASQVLDSASQPMAANYPVNFHRLFGDSDGNKSVDFLVDFIAFRNAFNQVSHTFDFDNSGSVDFLSDFIAFRNRFNSTLPP